MTVSPMYDPMSYLSYPAANSGDRIGQIRESAGFALGAIDWAVNLFAGFSPLEEWVSKPLGGDWSALDRGAVAWTNVGKSIDAVSDNIRHLPDGLGDAWQGETARAFAGAQYKVATAIEPVAGACDAMSQMCTALADMAQAITEFVLAIAVALAEFVTEMLIAIATVVGSVSTPAWITKLSINLMRWVPQLTRMITLFMSKLPMILKISKILKTVFSNLTKMLKILMTLANSTSGPAGQIELSANQVAAATGNASSGGASGSGGGGGGGGGF
ncbi:WXG100-like domain-containing protein [Salinibacterium sp. PAMC 21357]|uniref:WXG100-like domain-containing protein n=1 Tax=Salinibacterium sp. PAMC 21357 TaxID=1112215 RepID=UPI0002890452